MPEQVRHDDVRRIATLATGGALLLAATLIGLAVASGWTMGMDRAGLLAMAGGPTGFWLLWTRLGDTFVRVAVSLIALGALLARRRWLAGAGLFVTVGGAFGLNALAKALVARPRPDPLPHLDAVNGPGFPSGHAAGAAALAFGLAFYLVPPRWRGRAVAGGLVFMLLVGLSRVALGVHWPSDVVAGWCEGAGWALVIGATVAAIARSRGGRREG